MKLLSFLILALLCSAGRPSEEIYNYSVPRIEGGTQSLAGYRGKVLLIVTLPVEQSAGADSMLYCLDTLAAAHAANLCVIGVPSYEEGYTPAGRGELEQWYRQRLGTGIIITEGLYTSKASGAQQHPLYGWLTMVAKNGYFDMDAEGAGQMFFINGQGRLYGIVSPPVTIGGPTVQKILALQ